MPLPASSSPSWGNIWTQRFVKICEIESRLPVTWPQELNVEVSVFANKPVILQGVKLKESAFRDLDLPLRLSMLIGACYQVLQ